LTFPFLYIKADKLLEPQEKRNNHQHHPNCNERQAAGDKIADPSHNEQGIPLDRMPGPVKRERLFAFISWDFFFQVIALTS